MPTSTIVVLSFLALFILVGIIAPFFSKNAKQRFHMEESKDFLLSREEIFGQLSDLEYDYQMEKISQTDYDQLKAELTEKAAATMNLIPVDFERVEKEVDREIAQYLSNMISRKGRANEN